MRFEWNTAKAGSNVRKHGVSFSEAAVALQDNGAMTTDDSDSESEERLISVGTDDRGRMLVTIFTYRADAIRIIPSRRASKKERKIYEERQ